LATIYYGATKLTVTYSQGRAEESEQSDGRVLKTGGIQNMKPKIFITLL